MRYWVLAAPPGQTRSYAADGRLPGGPSREYRQAPRRRISHRSLRPVQCRLAPLLLKRAALKDHAEAAYTLGVMYRYAQGVPRNMTLTLKFFTIAANLDYAPAYNGLGAFFLDEERDRVRANEFFKLAAKMGWSTERKQSQIIPCQW